MEQLQHDIAHMSKESREAILGEASLPVHIPVDHGLAMKSDLQLPRGPLHIHQYGRS